MLSGSRGEAEPVQGEAGFVDSKRVGGRAGLVVSSKNLVYVVSAVVIVQDQLGTVRTRIFCEEGQPGRPL
jgi:hypothetical protein